MTQPIIRNVSDTARWVAFYRAMESERPDAVFRDPFARRLAGERGEAIVRTVARLLWRTSSGGITIPPQNSIRREEVQRSAHIHLSS